MSKAPNPVDKYVGSRMRMRRIMLGMSQEKLGEALGLTFQQIQKYEKGTNRIGASRLQQISYILQVPVAFFFEGAPNSFPLLERQLFVHRRGILHEGILDVTDFKVGLGTKQNAVHGFSLPAAPQPGEECGSRRARDDAGHRVG